MAVAEDPTVWHKQSASRGWGNPLLDENATRSCVRFLRRHATVPAVSIALVLVRMVIKRILVGRPDRLMAVLRGYRCA